MFGKNKEKDRKKKDNIYILDEFNDYFREDEIHAFFLKDNDIDYIKVGERIEKISFFLEEEGIMFIKRDKDSIMNGDDKEKERYKKLFEKIIITFLKSYNKKNNIFIKIKYNKIDKVIILEKDRIITSLYLKGSFFKINEFEFNKYSYVEKYYFGGLFSNNFLLFGDDKQEEVFLILNNTEEYLLYYMNLKRNIFNFQKEKENRAQII